MKKCLFTALLFFVFANSYCQQLDSIAYKFGHLYYHTYGKGEPIVMLSGGPGNDALQLESVALKLSNRYKVILLEQRGTGPSIPTPFDSSTITLKYALDDINLLLSHLNISKTILLGHSWGGNLAMIYAAQYPQKIKSLLLLAPGYFGLGWDQYRLFIDNQLAKLGKVEKDRLGELGKKAQTNTITDAEKLEQAKLKRLCYIYDKAKVDSLVPLLEGHNNETTFQLMLYSVMAYKFNLKKDLLKITAPIHVICGRQDMLNNIAYDLKLAKPSINLYWIDKSGHFPMHEQPEKFYAILDDALKVKR